MIHRLVNEFHYRLHQIICILCLKFNYKMLWKIQEKHCKYSIECDIASDSIFEKLYK